MALTAKPVLHPRQRADGTRQVRVRLTKDRKAVFLDAGFTLAEKHWNEKGARDKKNWVRGTEHEHARLNEHLRKLVDDADATAMQHPGLSAEQVRDRLAGAPAPAPAAAPDFVAFAQQYVADRARTDNPGTVGFYRLAVNDLARWRAGQPWPFTELSERGVLDFHAWNSARAGVHATTARDRMVKLGTIARLAVKRGLLDPRANPFPDLGLPVPAPKTPVRPPAEAEVSAILALELPAAPRWQRLGLFRDVWTLQMLARGTRIGDVLQLRERDVQAERLVFVETKTGKTKSVKRSPAINALLARHPPKGDPLAYVFPLLDHTARYAALNPTVSELAERRYAVLKANASTNYALRELCRLAGVPRFTSHAARHVFAAKAWGKLKDLLTLQQMLNHSSPLTTMRYLRQLGVDELDDATDAVWDNG